MVTINIKHDMPTVEEARKLLVERLHELVRDGVALVKVIHGYGSSGKGGKIRHGLVPTLRRLQTEGMIRCFPPGTEWDKSKKEARELLKGHPSLANDPDLGRGNLGCTIVAIVPRKRVIASEGPSGMRAPEDVENLFQSDPARVYDLYTRPQLIRRFKPERVEQERTRLAGLLAAACLQWMLVTNELSSWPSKNDSGNELFRDHGHDALFDCSTALVEHCKAIEVHHNRLLQRALVHVPFPSASGTVNAVISRWIWPGMVSRSPWASCRVPSARRRSGAGT